MTELILIRHGETDWNRQQRIQGQVDPPLNALGFEQARRLAERLRAEPAANRLVCSDLLRARQTAAPSAAAWGLVPELLLALREQAFGVVDGMALAEIPLRYAQAWADWLRFDPDFAFEGAESTRQFHRRVIGALHDLQARYADQTLLVITHGGVLDMVYRSAKGQSFSGPRQTAIPNAGFNRVRLCGPVIEILVWADTAHLDGLPPQPGTDQTRLLAVRPD